MMMLMILLQNPFSVRRIASVVQDNINAYRLAGGVEENLTFSLRDFFRCRVILS